MSNSPLLEDEGYVTDIARKIVDLASGLLAITCATADRREELAKTVFKKTSGEIDKLARSNDPMSDSDWRLRQLSKRLAISCFADAMVFSEPED